MIDYKLIGARIKEARKKANITQEVLAEKADITVVYLSKIENGKVHPSLETLHNVCMPISLDLGIALGNMKQWVCNDVFRSPNRMLYMCIIAQV